MLWQRRGLLFSPPARAEGVWHTHSQMPVLHHVSGSLWYMYFSGRNEANRSHAFRAELEIGEQVSVTRIDPVPTVAPGRPGSFDAYGAMPCSIIDRGNELWLYYQGWIVRNDVPFQTAIGLAISTDGGVTFEKYGKGPILAAGPNDEFSVLSPFVYRAEGDYWMYYPSITDWREWSGRPEPRYTMKRAISRDGLVWTTVPDLTLDFTSDDEGGLARPSILRQGNHFHMWYSHRGWKNYREGTEAAYRLGYASSPDGERWQRQDDDMGFSNPPLPGDWDDTMQAYPEVVQVGEDLLCFYSGNRFGQAGIGYARLEGGAAALASASARVAGPQSRS